MAAGSVEQIVVVLRAMTSKFNRAMDASSKKMDQMSQHTKEFNSVITMSLQGWRAANKAAAMGSKQFEKFVHNLDPQVLSEFNLRVNESGRLMSTGLRKGFISADNAQKRMTTGITSGGGKVSNAARHMTHGMRGFRMEMLGVMFFGMMLQRMFMGFLQPVMEAFGVFELFGLMLLIVFLPIMEALFPYFLQLMEFFMELPEPVKMVIGVFTIIGAIIGTIIMYLGAFALGIGSIIQLFGGAGAGAGILAGIWTFLGGIFTWLGGIIGIAVKFIIAVFVGLSAAAAAILIILVAVAVGIWLAFEENFMNIHQWVDEIFIGIGMIIDGALNMIMGLINFFIALVTGDFNGMKNAIGQVLDGLISFFVGLVKSIGGAFATIGAGVLKLVDLFMDSFDWLATELFKWIDKTFGIATSEFYQWGKDLIQSFINGIQNMAGAAGDAIGSVTGGVGETLGGIGHAVGLNDFVWRPGGPPASISPQDTLVGFKGDSPFGGGGASITNNFYGFTRDELRKELDDRDHQLVDELRRLVKQ